MKMVLEKRTGTGTREARRLRRAGRLPGVVYGRGQETTSVTLDRHAFEMLLRTGEHTIEGTLAGAESMFLIQDVQLDHMGDRVLHVDLRKVAKDEKVHVHVTVNGYGHPTGGILDHQMAEVEVECFPHLIPDKIEVPVAAMKVGDVIRVGDLPFPEGVVPLSNRELPVFALHAPRGEAELTTAVPGEGPAEPERIGGKKEEEEA